MRTVRISKLFALAVAAFTVIRLQRGPLELNPRLILVLAVALAMIWFPDWFGGHISSRVDPKTVRGVSMAIGWISLLFLFALAVGVSL